MRAVTDAPAKSPPPDHAPFCRYGALVRGECHQTRLRDIHFPIGLLSSASTRRITQDGKRIIFAGKAGPLRGKGGDGAGEGAYLLGSRSPG
jgi:hypothetical protein